MCIVYKYACSCASLETRDLHPDSRFQIESKCCEVRGAGRSKPTRFPGMTISGTTPSIHGIHGMHGMAIPGKKQRLPGMTISGTTPSIQGIHGMRGMTIPGKKHRQKQRCALEQNAPIEWIAHTKKTHATLSKFLAKRCMTDIFATGIFHETDVIKELSECVGMLRAVQRLGETLERVNFSDDASVQCIVSGDGPRPVWVLFWLFSPSGIFPAWIQGFGPPRR